MYFSEQKKNKRKYYLTLRKIFIKNNKLIRQVAEQICKRNSTRLLVLFSYLLLH